MRRRISPLHSVQNFESNEYKLAHICPLCPPDPLECAKPPLPYTKPLMFSQYHLDLHANGLTDLSPAKI